MLQLSCIIRPLPVGGGAFLDLYTFRGLVPLGTKEKNVTNLYVIMPGEMAQVDWDHKCLYREDYLWAAVFASLSQEHLCQDWYISIDVSWFVPHTYSSMSLA